MTVFVLAGGAGPARASDRWEEAASGAVALLPVPTQAKGIQSGSLFCIEQRWSFMLRGGAGGLAEGERAPARIVVDDAVFEPEAERKGAAILIGVQPDILDPLMGGARLSIAIGEKGALGEARFNLRNSSKVISAIVPRCSPVDMAPYLPVALSGDDAGMEDARLLTAEEAQLFRAETGEEPTLSAALRQLEGGRRLLFASLCGPKRYYGVSGCTLSGYAAQPAEPVWREVYNSEGLSLYIDPTPGPDGWPMLVTLPIGATEPDHWVWTGTEYQNRDAGNVAGDELADAAQEQGDGAQ